MYCKKLNSILEHVENKKYDLIENDIVRFSEYLENTTRREKSKLNPIRTSITTGIPLKKVIGFYLIGSYLELFLLKMFFECDCGEFFRVYKNTEVIECTECSRVHKIFERKSRIQLLFELLEKVVPCPNLSKSMENYFDEINFQFIDSAHNYEAIETIAMESGINVKKHIINLIGGGVK